MKPTPQTLCDNAKCSQPHWKQPLLSTLVCHRHTHENIGLHITPPTMNFAGNTQMEKSQKLRCWLPRLQLQCTAKDVSHTHFWNQHCTDAGFSMFSLVCGSIHNECLRAALPVTMTICNAQLHAMVVRFSPHHLTEGVTTFTKTQWVVSSLFVIDSNVVVFSHFCCSCNLIMVLFLCFQKFFI